MADKNYISGILIKEVGQYGKLNISINVEDFITNLREVANNGWANLTIAKNRNPTDKGYTHHCFENLWKPDQKKGSKEAREDSPYIAPEDESSLPF